MEKIIVKLSPSIQKSLMDSFIINKGDENDNRFSESYQTENLGDVHIYTVLTGVDEVHVYGRITLDDDYGDEIAESLDLYEEDFKDGSKHLIYIGNSRKNVYCEVELQFEKA